MISGLYPLFLDMGYDPSYFWELSLQEIHDLIDSYVRKQEKEQKEREAKLKDEIVVKDIMAFQTARYLARYMGSDIEVKRIQEYFPELFDNEKIKQEEIEKNLMINKAKMDAYVRQFNKAWEERKKANEDNDTRETTSHHRSTNKAVSEGLKGNAKENEVDD